MTTQTVNDTLKEEPIVKGKSKYLYNYDNDHYIAQLIPSLSSFTYDRYEMVEKTQNLRLDFYEMAVALLNKHDIPTAFVKRLDVDKYLTRKCTSPPFEVIVKNNAVGSTQRKYPGLFPDNHKFSTPIVKFDYRIDPEDIPISADYLKAYGEDPDLLKKLALKTNEILCEWLSPNVLIDFCLIFGTNSDGQVCITSEISPDCMRLKSEDGSSLDKDLFRQGKSHEEIIDTWTQLIADIKTK
ncbi:phosphoribosylaminoimidazolesuccinocarboxamide synthase [Flavivirga amylovorans]|uniref:Phosphoribosylaminoimidazolesuccinocarboxamide synthase n=1 Tax=Flavivirga amylovorans TaxID=870486 RepID=A0ABT8X1I0_9FLAO|nr:phosphoribosylaminoimidazolesuccinocarboxamide synthase [Flavivirga amylovorans]MDO5987770.1 phosphoribosylaminoimidazolesuccinocarboxamide synthase [Flavivirga amylovorans]